MSSGRGLSRLIILQACHETFTKEDTLMKENGPGSIFLRHLSMAAPWGIILLAVFFIAALGIKQQVKETVQYAARTAIYETLNAAYNYHFDTSARQEIKEGIEFAAKTAKNEIKELLNDPQVKKDLKDIIESSRK